MATRNDSTVEALALEAEAVLSDELSRPWPMHVEQCEDDREHAELLASCALLLV